MVKFFVAPDDVYCRKGNIAQAVVKLLQFAYRPRCNPTVVLCPTLLRWNFELGSPLMELSNLSKLCICSCP